MGEDALRESPRLLLPFAALWEGTQPGSAVVQKGKSKDPGFGKDFQALQSLGAAARPRLSPYLNKGDLRE